MSTYLCNNMITFQRLILCRKCHLNFNWSLKPFLSPPPHLQLFKKLQFDFKIRKPTILSHSLSPYPELWPRVQLFGAVGSALTQYFKTNIIKWHVLYRSFLSFHLWRHYSLYWGCGSKRKCSVLHGITCS